MGMEGGVGWNGALVGANVPVPAGGLVPLFARSAALSSVLGASVGFTAGCCSVGSSGWIFLPVGCTLWSLCIPWLLLMPLCYLPLFCLHLEWKDFEKTSVPMC